MFNQSNFYLHPESKTLNDLFKNSAFRIPDYQRAFAWSVKKGQFKTLWNDIVKTEQKNFNGGFSPIDQSIQKPHFIGAIVTETKQNIFDNFEDVIDGQQRLITLTVLLAVLCDYVQQVSDVTKRQNILSAVQGLVKEQGGVGTGVGSFSTRIKLNQEHDFFVKYVLEPSNLHHRAQLVNQVVTPNRIQSRILECLNFFGTQLNNHFGLPTDPTYDAKVERFTNTLLVLVLFLKINVIKPGLAYTIFETLNTRGLDLAQGDLIKNEIYRRATNGNERQKVMDCWKTMMSQLPDEDKAATTYIRHLYISQVEHVKASNLFVTISEYLDGTNATTYSDTLKSESSAYSVICGDTTSGDSATDDLLEEITDVLEVTATYPLLLAGAKVFGTGTPNFRQTVKLTRDFCFRFFTIGEESVEQIEQVMGDAARMLRSGGQLTPVQTFLKSRSPDSVFMDAFKDYVARKASLAFYIIKQIEAHLSAEAGMIPFGRSPQQHLEHIMPKVPTVADWGHVKTDDRYDTYVHRIGNLLVLEADINKTIKNKSYNVKVGSSPGLSKNYTHSTLKLPMKTNTYLKSGNWDFSSIEDRQKDLAATALLVWSLQ